MGLNLNRLISKGLSSLEKEVAVLKTLHRDVKAALKRMEAKDPGLRPFLDSAHGYAVFPSVGKATALVGGAFGKGEVFQRGDLVGYAGAAQLTVGAQLGGQTVAQIIAFKNRAALDRFKKGRWALAANASAVVVKAGAAASADYESGVAVFVASRGGLMVEAAVGGQKFFFQPAFLGRLKEAHPDAGKGAKAKSRRKPLPARRRTGDRPSATGGRPSGKRTRGRAESPKKGKPARSRARKTGR